MKYTKEQWARLNKEERSWLVYFYKHKNDDSGNFYIPGDEWGPDEYDECPICGTPVWGGGVCISCLDRAIKLEEKMGRG